MSRVTDTFVHLERRADGVSVVTLDRPKANALSVELLAQLEQVVVGLAADPPGAVVVTGGPKIFAAGADIAGFGGPEEAAVYGRQFRDAFDGLAALPLPVIAAVAGFALGGGCELALACDLRVASERAVFGQPEILLGLIPGAGGTQRLPRLIGVGRAKELIYTGRQVPAAEALAIGLVNRVVPAGAEMDEALGLAASLASGPSQALAMDKQAVDAGMDGSLVDGLDGEGSLFVEVFRTDDAAIGTASFLRDGPGQAVFTGS